MIPISEIPIRSYAHIGDAVYELYIREKTVILLSRADKLHELTTKLVNAEFQADLLALLDNFVNEEEQEILRRARNTSVTTARRHKHKLHRLSTAFEALVGYLHLHNKPRLLELFQYMDSNVEEKIKAYLDKNYSS